MMETYWLAFYKASGKTSDRVIRWVTQSPYSHVELILSPSRPDNEDKVRLAFSSSGRDGGVRTKKISFDPNSWDFIPIEWADDQRIQAAIKSQAGCRYDYLGLALSQLLNLRRGSPSKWFCSEIIAWVLDLPFPSALSPGDLAAWVLRLNRLHLAIPRGVDQSTP